MGPPYQILIGGILSLILLVLASLLDFFKREPRSRYDYHSRADSHHLFYVFLSLTAVMWVGVIMMEYGGVPLELGWPFVLLMFAGKSAVLYRDFTNRRLDVPNLMLRASLYEFIVVVVLLVVVSVFVHYRE